MPLWLRIVCIILASLFLCILFDILGTCFFCDIFKDKMLFKNKYLKKIYKCEKKLEKYTQKINKDIELLKCKSIYCENLKILHEKSLLKTYLNSKKKKDK